MATKKGTMMATGSYIDKENELIDAIAHMRPHWSVTIQPGYDPQEHRDAAFKRLSADTMRFFEYASAQEQLENASRQASRFYPGDAVAQVEHIRTFDLKRKDAHNAAIGAIRDLNQLCEDYGLEPFVDMTIEQTYDVRNRETLHHVSNSYVEQAMAANAAFAQKHPKLPHRTDEYETRRRQAATLADADADYERQQQREDYEKSHAEWRAVGTYDESMSYLYAPEQDEAMRARDPNYEETLARRDTERARDRREAKNVDMRTMIASFGLDDEPDGDDFEP